MKRRTILLILTPTIVITAAALMVGNWVATLLPQGSDVAALESVEESMALGDRIEGIEPYVAACLFIARLGLLFACAVILYHVSTFERVRKWRERVFGVARVDERERMWPAAAAAVAATLSAMFLFAANASNISPSSDEIPYLKASIEASEAASTLGFAKTLFAGRWDASDVHPLYPWVLMPVASRSVRFFIIAKLIASCTAALALGVLLLFVWRLFGAAPAALALFFYGLNMNFIDLSAAITPDVLLAVMVMLSVYFTVEGFKRPPLLGAAGAFAGLTYLTKLTGLLLPPAFFLAAVCVWRRKAFRAGWFYGYFAAFVVVASPLLVSNTVRHGNPLADRKFSMMWLDHKSQADTLAFNEGRVGAAFYFENHDALEMMARVVEGGSYALSYAAHTTSPLKYGYYKTSQYTSWPLRRWSGLLILAIAGVSLIFDNDIGRRTFVFILGLSAFAAMTWYIQVDAGPEVPFAFLPIVYGYFSVVVLRVIDSRKWRMAVLAFACLVGLVGTASRFGIAEPTRATRPAADVSNLAEWLRSHMQPGDVYLMGPDKSLEFGWHQANPGRRENVPITITVPALVRASRRRGARYIVISKGLYKDRPLWLSGYVTFDEANNMHIDRPIAGWRKVFEDPVSPVEYIVFEVEEGG